MDAIVIDDRISYIEATEDPLSADIGIIHCNGVTWLYDVGSDERRIASLQGEYNVVLSHFHQDHAGNFEKIGIRTLYVSKETYAHLRQGTIVSTDLYEGDLHVFPIPSSHAKGCLGLEVDGTYAFVGDALYGREKNGRYVYNAQLLKEEIEVLKKLRAPLLLVSHRKGLIRRKEEVIAELNEIYQRRVKSEPLIEIKPEWRD